MPGNGFYDLPIHEGGTDNKPNVSFAMLKDYYRRGAEEKLLRTSPSRTWESALLEHRVKVASFIDLCAQKGN